MPVNADKPQLWKADIAHSVDFYNEWFMSFAPQAYRDTRVVATKEVEEAFQQTQNLTAIIPQTFREFPGVLPMLRMATAPPIARDRLIGLAGVSKTLVNSMGGEKGGEKRGRSSFRMALCAWQERKGGIRAEGGIRAASPFLPVRPLFSLSAD